MEVTKTSKSQMFRDRREGDRRAKDSKNNEDIRQSNERRSSDRRNNKDFNDAPWWLQRSYLDESSDQQTILNEEYLAERKISVSYH